MNSTRDFLLVEVAVAVSASPKSIPSAERIIAAVDAALPALTGEEYGTELEELAERIAAALV